jgi:hypothetical protein
MKQGVGELASRRPAMAILLLTTCGAAMAVGIGVGWLFDRTRPAGNGVGSGVGFLVALAAWLAWLVWFVMNGAVAGWSERRRRRSDW